MKYLYLFCVICILSKFQLIYGQDIEEGGEEEEGVVEGGEYDEENMEEVEPEEEPEEQEVEPEEQEVEPEPEPEKQKEEEEKSKSTYPEKKVIASRPTLVEYKLPTEMPKCSVILTNMTVTLGRVLAPLVRHTLALTDDRPPQDTVALNLEIMNRQLNSNYKNSKNFLKKIEQKFPLAQKYFRVSKKSFTCDEDFCKKFGEGLHAFGICTPYYCQCSELAGIQGMKCKDDLIFDPLYQDCDNVLKIMVCGF